MRTVIATMLGLAGLASLAASPPAVAQRAVLRSEAAVPFKAGETLTYDVSWSSLLVAGTATATVVEKKPSSNSTAYYIVAEGRPLPILTKLYKLYYKMDTLVDSFTLLSQRGSLYSEEGAAHQLGSTRFDRTARRAFYERQQETTANADFPVPANAQDGLAALYAVRTRALRAGEAFTTPVADSGALYTVKVDVGGAPAQVKVPLGEFDAWSLKAGITDAQGQPVWKNIVVWISNDARRLPVKLQAELPVGQFVLALRAAR
jgi:Protein of unknown function (DUF3108)